eukprot:6040828-Amphidinium_carterae.2
MIGNTEDEMEKTGRGNSQMGSVSTSQGPDMDGWLSLADLNKMGKGHELIRFSMIDSDLGNIVACQKCECKGSKDGSEPAKLRRMQEGLHPINRGEHKSLRVQKTDEVGSPSC